LDGFGLILIIKTGGDFLDYSYMEHCDNRTVDVEQPNAQNFLDTFVNGFPTEDSGLFIRDDSSPTTFAYILHTTVHAFVNQRLTFLDR